MDLGLKGKTAIVTGGSKGIGKAVAFALAREDADVSICARGMAELEAAASEIQADTGRRVLPVQADMNDPVAIKRMVDTTVSELGGVDILINNAVNSSAAPFMELTDEQWMNHINVKVMGYIRCSREVLPHMVERGGGRIIMIGGMAARRPGRLTNSNGVTNSAVSNLAKNLSDQFAPQGILVNCIHPGATKTPRLAELMERRARDAGIDVEEEERREASTTPIGRMILPEEVADLVLFFVSDHAAAITGQTIAIDGGSAQGVFY